MGQRIEKYNKQGQLIDVVDTRKIEDTKIQTLVELKEKARDTMTKTDWLLTRKYERNKDIPDEIAKWRQAVVEKIEDIEKDFESITTLEQFDKYYEIGKCYDLIKAQP